MPDPLHDRGSQRGARGLPLAGPLRRVPQVQAPIRSDAPSGQQLGDAAVRVTRSTFLRNLAAAAVTVQRGPRAGAGWARMPWDGTGPA